MAALQTVQKIGPVLDLFTVRRPEWGVTEVAAEIGVPRSSAHALLASLVDIGLLQCRSRGRYRIGWRVVELNQTLQGTVDVRTVAAPALAALSESTVRQRTWRSWSATGCSTSTRSKAITSST